MTIDGTVTAMNQGVVLGTKATRAVVLGANDTNALRASGGTLGLTNAELNQVRANFVGVANADNAGSQGIDVQGAINLTSAANLG
ncbi:MAG: hypothetical protein IPH54_16370 [Rhodoferax sp.]|nr:hypothetical protein [Rhodoferax sp.]